MTIDDPVRLLLASRNFFFFSPTHLGQGSVPCCARGLIPPLKVVFTTWFLSDISQSLVNQHCHHFPSQTYTYCLLIERFLSLLVLVPRPFATMISMIMVLNQKGDIMISRQYRCVLCHKGIDGPTNASCVLFGPPWKGTACGYTGYRDISLTTSPLHAFLHQHFLLTETM